MALDLMLAVNNQCLGIGGMNDAAHPIAIKKMIAANRPTA